MNSSLNPSPYEIQQHSRNTLRVVHTDTLWTAPTFSLTSWPLRLNMTCMVYVPLVMYLYVSSYLYAPLLLDTWPLLGAGFFYRGTFLYRLYLLYIYI